MKFLKTSAAVILAIFMTPALANANNFGSDFNAHDACKRGEDNRQILGGLAGAVAGGVFGSQVAGNGARTEGSVIGAVVGGLAGVGIADKTVDCDPVYEDTGFSQAPQTTGAVYTPQPTSQYGTVQQGTLQYGTTTQYGSNGYGTTTSYPAQTSTQPYYEDRVTVSNHPVYSDPTYGAGGLSQGQTYSTGNVTYPPSGNNSQYGARTYSAPTEVIYASSAPAPVTTYAQAPVRNYAQASSQSYTPAPRVIQPVIYTAPRQIAVQQQARRHYHGRHSCNMHH